jgi:3-isopropylmalate/(R)-2-methylmalate dehydratase small subunit
VRGVIHKYGDHVDTDVIIPARFLSQTDPAFLAAHCMEDIDRDFASRVKPGDLMVAGLNFGCGSSREHAPVAIRAAGIRCVIAESFARIFYRNAINIGLPVLECPEAARDAQAGDELEADLSAGTVRNLRNGKTYTAAPFPPFMRKIIAAGGLVAYTKAKLEGQP